MYVQDDVAVNNTRVHELHVPALFFEAEHIHMVGCDY